MQGECLAADGLGWEAAGHADEADYIDACETWAWEQVRIDRASGRRGATGPDCEARTALVRYDGCEALDGPAYE